jgi:succinate dehydrogenase hydrophobic anchor subunit
MRPNQNPLFRKVIAPWYDSELACIIVIIFMVLVLCFGWIGMSTALDNPSDQGHAWVPLLLMLMSFFVLISTAVRLVGRNRRRYAKYDG